MKSYLSELFFEIAEELDLTESQGNAIEKAYNAVADWLNRNDSKLKKYNIHIYPQGSMRLGTVVKPLSRDDYDVDMVCLLHQNTYGLQPQDIKKLVGDRLKESDTYKRILQPEGKRCWTLEYAESLNFHMDILPAIPNGEEAIKATHKESTRYIFIPTNPHGYAEWFKKRMQKPIAFNERGNIENIPDYPRKTPLQKVIQLLKRHRDVMFINDQEVAPASIIITTLAAKIYNHEIDILTLFEKIIKEIPERIENRDGTYWVSNPVNSSENFADKWKNDKKKQEAFFDWVRKVNSDFTKLMKCQTSDELLSCLYSMFGQKIVDLTHNNLGGYNAIVPKALKEKVEIVPIDTNKALAVPHRKKAPWKLPPWNIVQIEATASKNGFSKRISSEELLDKGMELLFKAVHGIQSPYTVQWQITNTGYQAEIEKSLRGDFYDSDEGYTNIRTEKTFYSGIHYIQCFIIKKIKGSNKCVAKSRPFIVRIK